MQISTKLPSQKIDFEQIYQDVISNREPVEISINDGESVSVILTSELKSLLETRKLSSRIAETTTTVRRRIK
jgi:hypothetical protein